MLRRLCWVLSLGVVVCGLSGSAFADFRTPSWWQDVQFGGSGIVNGSSKMVFDEVSIKNESGQEIGKVRLALMAHGRYAYSQTVDVNTQRYYVETGKFGGTDPRYVNYARWNFGWYVASDVHQYLGVKLSYDFDPGIDSDPLNYVWFIANFSSIPDGNDSDSTVGEVEDSWNLAMSFLTQSGAVSDLDQDGRIDKSSYPFPFPKGVYVVGVTPTSVNFDPNVNGEYTFKLEVYDSDFKTRYGGIEMRVNAVPEPATLVGLASLGATGLGAVVLRRRKKA